MTAYDYPLMGIFWTMLWWFLWIAWLIMLFRIFGDIFRSSDMGGWAKAFWSIFIIVVPLFGALIYLIARGRGMAERDIAQAQEREQAFRSYVQQTAAGTPSSADELTKLAELRDRGVITPDEFAQQKAKLLA
jgi:heme exporter protein D